MSAWRCVFWDEVFGVAPGVGAAVLKLDMLFVIPGCCAVYGCKRGVALGAGLNLTAQEQLGSTQLGVSKG